MKSQVVAVLSNNSLERSLILNFTNDDIGTLGGGVLATVTTSDVLAHIDIQISSTYHVIFLFSVDYPYFNLNMSGNSVGKIYCFFWRKMYQFASKVFIDWIGIWHNVSCFILLGAFLCNLTIH